MKYLGFTVVVLSEQGQYASWCPELEIASQGATVKEAIENIKEALELRLESLTEKELNEIKKHKKSITTTVKVPLPA